MANQLTRTVVHLLTNIRRWQYRQVEQFAKGQNNKRILELGSGPLVHGRYYYSTKHLFDDDNDFTQSDIVKRFGHKIIDVTTMKFNNEFDIVLCLNVLEHVYDYQKAIDNIYTALKKGGVAVVAVPTFYPLHDEPADYWRFTEHALRKMFSGYKNVTISHNGKRQYPFTYYLEATK
jgi:SAM-dependent methyltransferase